MTPNLGRVPRCPALGHGVPQSWVSLSPVSCRQQGLVEGWRGWSVAMKVGTQWAELAGHDYVLDLISDLELLQGFPKQKSCFLIAWDGAGSRDHASRA